MSANVKHDTPVQQDGEPEFGLDGANTFVFHRRLTQLVDALGMSKGDFAGLLSIPDKVPGVYGDYNAHTLTIPHILFLEQRMNVSAAWLMSGVGPMFVGEHPPHKKYDWCVAQPIRHVDDEVLKRRWLLSETIADTAAALGITAAEVKDIEVGWEAQYTTKHFWEDRNSPVPSPDEQRIPELSMRLQRALYDNAITLSKCAGMDKSELIRLPGLGRKTYNELIELLQRLGH